MSLLNETLRNLEQRRQALPKSNGSFWDNLSPVENKHTQPIITIPYIVVCAFLLLSIAIYTAWLIAPRTKTTPISNPEQYPAVVIKPYHYPALLDDRVVVPTSRLIKALNAGPLPMSVGSTLPSSLSDTPITHLTHSKHTPIQKKLSVQGLIDENYDEALNLIHQQQFSSAINKLKVLLGQAPDFNQARETLATVLLQQQQTVEANQLLQEGLQRQPNYLPFVKLQARLMIIQNDYRSALKLLENHSPEMEVEPDYYAELAALYQQSHQPLLAAKLYNQLSELYPDNGTWWAGLGIALEGISKNNAALEAYEKALATHSLNPKLANYVENRAHFLGG